MLKPSEVAKAFKKVEKENYRFRTYLKIHGNSKELDRQFKQMHKTMFETYDCDACRNCCKEYSAQFSDAELKKAAKHLELTREVFMDRYVVFEEGDYKAKDTPCNFLSDDGSCLLEGAQPEGCIDFPFTNKKDRLSSLYSMLNVASVCPVVFEMFEELKRSYKFKG